MIRGCPLSEVADVFDYSPRQLRRLADEGEIPTIIGPAGEHRVMLRHVRDLAERMSPDGLSTVGTLPKLYSVMQAAELLGVSVKTVRRLIDEGELQAYQLTRSADGRRGSSIRIAEDELRRFLEGAAL